MAITTSQIPGLLLPGARKVAGDYKKMPVQFSKIYATGKSDMEAERTIHVRYLSLPELKAQGAPTTFDMNAGQRWVYNHLHTIFGFGYSITREAMDDNLYKSAFNPANLGLQKVFAQMKEIQAASILNTGNVTSLTVGGDNFPLFYSAHPVDGGTVPNAPTQQVGLNEASMLMATNMIRRFRDDANILYGSRATKLVVPVELRHVAARLWNTEARPGTADRDLAVFKENNDLDGGYVVLDFLTSPFAWFMMSDTGGLIHLERKAFETTMQVDFTTKNLMVMGYERYHMGFDNWRLGVGVYPSN